VYYMSVYTSNFYIFFFQAEDGIRDFHVTGVQTCALPIYGFVNLEKHIENVKSYGMPILVAINHFDDDSKEEIELLKEMCSKINRSEERRVGKECRSRW